MFIHTDAVPTNFADVQVPDVTYMSDAQRQVLKELRDRPSATARELAADVDASKRTVARTLRRLAEDGQVTVRERAGEHGADLFRALAGGGGVAQAGLDAEELPSAEEITTDTVWSTYTWLSRFHPRAMPAKRVRPRP